MLILAIFGVVALTSIHSKAFLLRNNCLAPAPCTCSGSGSSYVYINCYGKSLNTTPHFMKADRHVSELTVQLYSNHLTTIPNYAFKNLSTVNATQVNIDLHSNKISTIDRYALSGIENVTTELNLQNNNLSSIPIAVYNLPALKSLYLQGNPLKSLSVFTHSEIVRTLQTFGIDLNEFSSWPAEFRLLKTLESLTIRHINLSHLNSEAFQGFEHSLTSLNMQYATNLEKIPNAVCQLSNLQSLTLKYFNKLNENSTSIFDHCTTKLYRVTSLNLGIDKLTKFPDIFHIFPSVTSFYIYVNSLEIIESEKIPTNNVLSHLDLDSNQFKRIPNALNKLKRLTYLTLQSNSIFSIEDHDISGLVHLSDLVLYKNPIKYISSHAFRNNKALSSLNLSGTKLKSIPAAVMSLPNLSTLYMSTIPCTCELSYLRGWNATAVRSFSGTCSYSGIKIQSFIMSSLQQCP